MILDKNKELYNKIKFKYENFLIKYIIVESLVFKLSICILTYLLIERVARAFITIIFKHPFLSLHFSYRQYPDPHRLSTDIERFCECVLPSFYHDLDSKV